MWNFVSFLLNVFSVGKNLLLVVSFLQGLVAHLGSLGGFFQPVWGMSVSIDHLSVKKIRKGKLWVIFLEICHVCIDDQGFWKESTLYTDYQIERELGWNHQIYIWFFELQLFLCFFQTSSIKCQKSTNAIPNPSSPQFCFPFSAGNGCFVLGSILFVIDARPQSVKTPIETRSTEI